MIPANELGAPNSCSIRPTLKSVRGARRTREPRPVVDKSANASAQSFKASQFGRPGHFSFMYAGYHHSSFACMPVSPRSTVLPVASEAAAVSNQLIGKSQRQIGQRADIDRDHRELLVAVELDGATEQTEARIVDEEFDFNAFSGQRGGNLVAGVCLLEVARNHDWSARAFDGDFRGQYLQPVGASRHHRHAMAVGSKDTYQLSANPRRSTRNQRHTLGHSSRTLKPIRGYRHNLTRA